MHRAEELVLLAPRLVPLSRARRHEAVGLLAAVLLDVARQRGDGIPGAFDSEMDGGFRGAGRREQMGEDPRGGRKAPTSGRRDKGW